MKGEQAVELFSGRLLPLLLDRIEGLGIER